MLETFYPSERKPSTYAIDFKAFYDKGYRGVIFDIDNTLVEHGEPADFRAKALFASLKELGMKAGVVSNNREPRVKSFADEVGIPYVYKADKPSVRGYVSLIKKMGTKKSNTLFVGDQLFTDVWGANRTGLYSILVDPIDPKEEIQIILKRIPEKLVLFFYERRLTNK